MKCCRHLKPSAVSSDTGYIFFVDTLAELFLGPHLFPPPARRERYCYTQNVLQHKYVSWKDKVWSFCNFFSKAGAEPLINSPDYVQQWWSPIQTCFLEFIVTEKSICITEFFSHGTLRQIFLRKPSSKIANRISSEQREKELCFVLEFRISDISPNCVSSSLTMHYWPLSLLLLAIRRNRENVQINRMTETASVIDFAERKNNSGNPSMTNAGAAEQTASTNHLQVFPSSLLTLNQCYISSHPKHEIPSKEKFSLHSLSQLHPISEQHY